MLNILHNYDIVRISGKYSNSQIFMRNLRNMYHNEYDLDLYINEPVLQWFKSESENKDSQIFKNFVNLRNDKNLPDLKTRKPLEIIEYLIETVEKSRDTNISPGTIQYNFDSADVDNNYQYNVMNTLIQNLYKMDLYTYSDPLTITTL